MLTTLLSASWRTSLFSISRAPSCTRTFSSSPICEAGYKMKSHNGAKKRWRSVGAGDVFKRAKAYRSHLNVSKSSGRVNKLGLTTYSNHSQTVRLKKQLLPYGSA